MAETRLNKNTPQFMMEFMKRWRDSKRDQRALVREMQQAAAAINKLQAEVDKMPSRPFFGESEKKQKAQETLDAAKKAVAEHFTSEEVLNRIKNIDASEKQELFAEGINAIVNVAGEIGNSIKNVYEGIVGKPTEEVKEEVKEETKPFSASYPVAEILRQTKERQARGEQIPSGNSNVSQEEWENHLRELGVDVDGLKGNTNTDAKTPSSTAQEAPAATTTPAPVEDTAEYVEYTYKPGDTFGQVIKDLGLGEGNLWGENGTVKYYTDQLWAEHPEVFDSRGNIKVGHTIKLRKRGTGGAAGGNNTATPAQNTQPASNAATVSKPANLIPDGAYKAAYDTTTGQTTYVPVSARVS